MDSPSFWVMGEEKEHKQKQNREHMFETYSYKNL